jgi:transcription antitermination factor NusG
MAEGESGSAARGHGNRRVFRLGDAVRIKAGPFAAFTGRIEGINQSKTLLKVAVEIFGRTTPVKLRFSEVEQVAWTEEKP